MWPCTGKAAVRSAESRPAVAPGLVRGILGRGADFRALRPPARDALERLPLFVRRPEGGGLPSARAREDLENLRGDVLERLRDRELPSDRVARFAVALESPLLGHVLRRSEQLDGLTVVAEHDLTVRFDHAQLAPGPHDRVLVTERLACRDRSLHEELHPFAGLGMDAIEKCLEARLQGRRIEAEDAIQLLGPGHHACADVPLPASDPGELLRLRELALALGDGLSRALSPGDVLDLGDRVARLSLVVADERDVEQPPDDAAVGPQIALLELKAGDRAGGQLSEQLLVLFPVGWVRDALEVTAEKLLLGVPSSSQSARLTWTSRPPSSGPMLESVMLIGASWKALLNRSSLSRALR